MKINLLTILGFFVTGLVGPVLVYLGQRQDSDGDKSEIIKENKTNVDSINQSVDEHLKKFDKKLDKFLINVDLTNQATIPFFSMLRTAMDDLKKETSINSSSLSALESDFTKFKTQITSKNHLDEKSRIEIERTLSAIDETIAANVPNGKDWVELQNVHNAIAITREYLTQGKYIESTESGGLMTLELRVSDLKDDSRIKFVHSLLSDPETIRLTNETSKLSSIRKKHDAILTFLNQNVVAMIKPWKKISDEYSTQLYGERNENMVTISGSGYSSEFTPEALDFQRFGSNEPETIKVRFNLGNLKTSPLMELDLFINYNSTSSEQDYLVLGALIPKNSPYQYKPVRISESKVKRVNFDNEDAKFILLQDIKEVFKQLDDLLTHNN